MLELNITEQWFIKSFVHVTFFLNFKLYFMTKQSIVRKTKESVKKRYFHPKCNKIPTNNEQILCNNFCLTRVEKLVEVDG